MEKEETSHMDFPLTFSYCQNIAIARELWFKNKQMNNKSKTTTINYIWVQLCNND